MGLSDSISLRDVESDLKRETERISKFEKDFSVRDWNKAWNLEVHLFGRLNSVQVSRQEMRLVHCLCFPYASEPSVISCNYSEKSTELARKLKLFNYSLYNVRIRS